MSGHALILNASFEPLHVVSWKKAIQLVFQGKVEVVEESDREVRSVSVTFRVPAVLRLISYIPLSRARQIVKFSRANIFWRDKFQCQYCLRKFPKTQLTLDHVVPVVQGGQKCWENIVTSCKRCNQRKGGRTPQQAGMKLTIQPREPRWLPIMTIRFENAKIPPAWRIYFGQVIPD